jgi:hypothetical protein
MMISVPPEEAFFASRVSGVESRPDPEHLARLGLGAARLGALLVGVSSIRRAARDVAEGEGRGGKGTLGGSSSSSSWSRERTRTTRKPRTGQWPDLDEIPTVVRRHPAPIGQLSS